MIIVLDTYINVVDIGDGGYLINSINVIQYNFIYHLLSLFIKKLK